MTSQIELNLSAITQDEDLPVCNTCGCQWGTNPAPETCPICLDDRQWVPAGGSVWTSLKKLSDSGRHIEFKVDPDDPNITFLLTVPHTGIGQMPLLVKSTSGYVLIECCSFVDAAAVTKIKELVDASGQPFQGIAISHPHWYNSATVWARALGGCPIYASALDKEWWMRTDSIDEVTWFEGESIKIGGHTTLILCGGHFDGACVTHVDRGEEKGGFLATADIIMISPCSKLRQVSFMYSYPNYIPLSPPEVVLIWNRIKSYPFTDAYGAWLDRRFVGDARKTIFDGVSKQLIKQGFTTDQFSIEY